MSQPRRKPALRLVPSPPELLPPAETLQAEPPPAERAYTPPAWMEREGLDHPYTRRARRRRRLAIAALATGAVLVCALLVAGVAAASA